MFGGDALDLWNLPRDNLYCFRCYKYNVELKSKVELEVSELISKLNNLGTYQHVLWMGHLFHDFLLILQFFSPISGCLYASCFIHAAQMIWIWGPAVSCCRYGVLLNQQPSGLLDSDLTLALLDVVGAEEGQYQLGLSKVTTCSFMVIFINWGFLWVFLKIHPWKKKVHHLWLGLKIT